MADIDDELLALAGEASSDEEDGAPMNISRETSAAPDNRNHSSSAKVSIAKNSAGKKSTRRQNDSEEEGEA